MYFPFVLTAALPSPPLEELISAALSLLEEKFPSLPLIAGEGVSPLSQLLSLIILGDYLSVYLALLQGIDPTPVEAIEKLKERQKDVPA